MVSRSAFVLTFFLLLLFVQTPGSGSAARKVLDSSRRDAEAAIAAADAFGQQAFVQVLRADGEGGNVTALAERFNRALEMVDRARVFLDEGLPDKAVSSAESAQGIFKSVGSEAEVLRIQAGVDASTRRSVVLLVAPVAVILITVFSYLLVRFWQGRRIRRTLEMEIKEAGTP